MELALKPFPASDGGLVKLVWCVCLSQLASVVLWCNLVGYSVPEVARDLGLE